MHAMIKSICSFFDPVLCVYLLMMRSAIDGGSHHNTVTYTCTQTYTYGSVMNSGGPMKMIPIAVTIRPITISTRGIWSVGQMFKLGKYKNCIGYVTSDHNYSTSQISFNKPVFLLEFSIQVVQGCGQ